MLDGEGAEEGESREGKGTALPFADLPAPAPPALELLALGWGGLVSWATGEAEDVDDEEEEEEELDPCCCARDC